MDVTDGASSPVDDDVAVDGRHLRIGPVSIDLPPATDVTKHVDLPEHVDRWLDLVVPHLVLSGRVVVERPPVDFAHRDAAFAATMAPFEVKPEFAWVGRVSVDGSATQPPAEVGEFTYGVDRTRGMAQTMDLGSGRTCTVVYLFPDAEIASARPVAAASLDSLAVTHLAPSEADHERG